MSLVILSHFLLLSGTACQRCSDFEVPLASPEAQRATNTSPQGLPGSYFSMAFTKQPRTHTIAYCLCLNPHHLPPFLHTNNLLNVDSIKVYSSSHTGNQSFSFSMMVLQLNFDVLASKRLSPFGSAE